MSSPKPTLLILGAGANIGHSVANKFRAKGYNVVLASRSLSDSHTPEGDWSFKLDLGNPEAIAPFFERVGREIGIPSVVVYNAYANSTPPATHPFSIPLAAFEHDLAINTSSTYAAAQQAIQAFEALPDSIPKAFIFTGNILNTLSMPSFLTLGIGKSASASLMQAGANSYGERGYCFYYADQRTVDGGPVLELVDGEAHAEHYFGLVGLGRQGPWLSTFVKGRGYIPF